MKQKSEHKIPLPAVNPAEDLETISRNKFSLLLDPALFEIRPELQRDKGIDLIVELKQDNSYTNFRFAVQLKSTQSTKPNKDNSISYPVDVANVNYLMNYGMPAYYILYDHTSGNFYLESTQHVFQAMIKKHHPEKLPQQFTVQFYKQLNNESIAEIYTTTLQSGMLIRRINTQLSLAANTKTIPSGILIDDMRGVYSVEQNIEFINNYGLELLNQQAYSQIIEIEQRTYPRTIASPTFNLVCGIAYYYRGSLLRALEFLKAAQLSSKEFHPFNKLMLNYTFLQAKNMLGMIEESAYKKAMAELMKTEEVGSYLGVEKAYAEFLDSTDPDEIKIKSLQHKLSQLIAKEPNINPLRIRCHNIILEIEGKSLLHAMHLNFVLFCGRVADIFSTKTYEQWKQLENAHEKRVMTLMKFSMETDSLPEMVNVACGIARWDYQKKYVFHAIKNWDSKKMAVRESLSQADLTDLGIQATKMLSIIGGYKTSNNRENIVHALFLRYEILHFAGKIEDAKLVAEEIEAMIEEHDLNGLKAEFNELLSGNLSHTKFIASFTNHVRQIFMVADNSGIGEYFKEPIPKGGLELIEKNIKWPEALFFPLDYPPVENGTFLTHLNSAMSTELKIVYEDYIPDKLIREFAKANLQSGFKWIIEEVKNKGEYHNFDGPEWKDIVIYISQHPTELVVTGLLVPTALEILKSSVSKLWSQLTSLGSEVRELKQEKELTMVLHFTTQDKEIEVVFDGNIKSKNLQKIVATAFQFLQSKQMQDAAFLNGDHVITESAKPKIRIRFNEQLQRWEPENFEELKRKWDELRDSINKNIID